MSPSCINNNTLIPPIWLLLAKHEWTIGPISMNEPSFQFTILQVLEIAPALGEVYT